MVITFVKRPTSPLHFEPFETPPEDILCPGSDQEYDYDDEKRAKKKVRIEILGKQYLEGRPLFIQSAGLRGPFEKDWDNPWAFKRRKRGIDDPERFFPDPHTEQGRNLRRSEAGRSELRETSRSSRDNFHKTYHSDLEHAASVASRSPSREGHTAKRRRQDLPEVSNDSNEAQRLVEAGHTKQDSIQKHWLKTDRTYLQGGSRSGPKSPTPTTATKSRVTRPVTLPLEKEQRTPVPSPGSSHVRKSDVRTSRSSPSNKRSVSNDKDLQPGKQSKPHRRGSEPQEMAAEKNSDIGITARTLTMADGPTRHGYEEAKRLSQEAVKLAEKEDGYLQAKKLSQEAASRAYHNTMGEPSRLEPYVSDFVITADTGSTAGLKAASRPPRPSPHVAPSSSNLQEFQYRYTRKTCSDHSAKKQDASVEAPEAIQPRSKSDSMSSSESDAFAEELEAAQAKAASKTMASTHSSSPLNEGQEPNNIKDIQASRQRAFTPTGRAKVARSRTSSRPSPSSSLVDKAKGSRGAPNKNDLVRKESTKSSDLAVSNGIRSRNSVVLPEAQVVPDAAIQLAQARSDPSTNLLETDKQATKLPSFDDEGDSYLDISTQAAFLKAQRSFKDDVLSSLEDSLLHAKIETINPAASRYYGPDITPLAKSRTANGATTRPIARAEENDDEEPMSTQAMVDAMSPFAITTIKKRPPTLKKRTSFAPSPTKDKPPTPTPAPILSPTTTAFRRHSLSMSTSPSQNPKQSSPNPLSNPNTTSKPPSTLTSFSILPNGTLTETAIYQDGQQQPQNDWDTSLPLDPLGLPSTEPNPSASAPKQPSSLDLNAAIDDAGSFLGDWDVELEARKEGGLSRKRGSEREREMGPKSILSVGGGSGA